MPLPRPRRLARLLVRLFQGDDAPAFAADLEDLTARRGGSRLGRWFHAWRHVLSGLGRPLPRRGAARRLRHLHPRLAFRLALRSLSRDPVTALTAIAVLTLGLAAPTVFFSILWGSAFTTLPVPEGEEIVRLEVVQPSGSGRVVRVTPEDAAALAALPEFEGVGSYVADDLRISAPNGAALRLAGAEVDAATLDLLGVQPDAGRIPDVGEEPAWLVTAAVWPRVRELLDLELGESGNLEGVPHTLTGVMPDNFRFPLDHDAWRLVQHQPGAEVSIVARLADGVTTGQASAAAARAWARRDVVREVEARDATVRILGFTADRGEGAEALLMAALMVVGVALLAIAIANVSNLLLLRSADRRGALAIQGALGAGRGQLALQTFIEALLLTGVGGILGLALASVGADYVQSTLGPRNLGYHWIEIGIYPGVVGFALLLVLGTALLASLVPMTRLWRADIHGLIKQGDGGIEPPGRLRLGPSLVAVQLALSCGALVASGLMVEGTLTARAFGRTLPAEEVLMLPVTLEGEGLDGELLPARRDAALAEMERALAQVPGRTALGTGAPGFRELATQVRLDDAEETEAHPSNTVSPTFFDLMDVELLTGRGFGATDTRASEPVAVVNRAWVERNAPGSGGLGVILRAPNLFGDTPVRVVGLVEDVQLVETSEARLDRVYFAAGQLAPREVMILARSVDLAGLQGPLREVLAGLPITLGEPMTLAEGHRFMTRAQRTFGMLVLLGGVSGLLVAAVGLYGVLSFRIRRRRREFGIRLALGADGASLARSVFAVSLRQVVPAILIGCAFAWLVSPVAALLTFGNDPRAPGVYIAVAGVFGGVSLIATWIPARRAARTDPMRTLRTE